MNDAETIARFIFMRSQGWTYNRITMELNVSKTTLIKWGRQHQFEIQNLRATETEALAERIFGERHKRWEALSKQLKQIEDEIGKRDPEEIPASKLHSIAARLRDEIARETGHTHFSETTAKIPSEEYVICKHEWQA